MASLVAAIVFALIEAISHLPGLLDAALLLIEGLTDGILQAVPVLLGELPAIIDGIIGFLMSGIPNIIQTGYSLLISIVEALPQVLTHILALIPQIIDGIIGVIMGTVIRKNFLKMPAPSIFADSYNSVGTERREAKKSNAVFPALNCASITRDNFVYL